MTWLIDAHTHLDSSRFNEDREELLARLPEEGVLAVVNPGCDLESSDFARKLAAAHPSVFACLGNHPHEAQYYNSETEEAYRQWAKETRVVAIGEIGLDYYYDHSPRSVQRDVFERQLQLTKDLGLPAVIHSREAAEDSYAVLKNFGSSIKVLMHSFGESYDSCEKFLDMGYFISLGGMVTFKNAVNPPEIARRIPADRLLLETDAPYLAPVPKRGKRNEPAYLRYSLEKMAELRGEPADRLADRIFQNTVAFYGIEEDLTALMEGLRT